VLTEGGPGPSSAPACRDAAIPAGCRLRPSTLSVGCISAAKAAAPRVKTVSLSTPAADQDGAEVGGRSAGRGTSRVAGKRRAWKVLESRRSVTIDLIGTTARCTSANRNTAHPSWVACRAVEDHWTEQPRCWPLGHPALGPMSNFRYNDQPLVRDGDGFAIRRSELALCCRHGVVQFHPRPALDRRMKSVRWRLTSSDARCGRRLRFLRVNAAAVWRL